jgi:nitrite reductase/ring-hydroxylating ferredoxin subunit
MTDNLIEVARLDQIPDGASACFTVGGTEIAIFNVGGSIFAMDDSCLHKGASLASGELDGKIVTCRAHGWRYDVTTGSTLNSPGYGVTSYATKVVDGTIFVALPD